MDRGTQHGAGNSDATRLKGGLLDQEPVTVVGLDPELRIRWIEGRPEAGWTGRAVGELVDATAGPELEALARKALESRTRSEASLTYRHHGVHRLRVTARPHCDELVLVIVDESHERHREQAMKLVADLLHGSDTAITSVDEQGRFNSWNRGAEKLFGYTADEVLGHPVADLDPLGGANASTLLASLRQGETLEAITTRTHRDGHPVQVSLTMTPVFDEEGVYLGASAIIVDVSAAMAETARQEAMVRQLERSMHFAETFMGMLAHDLRNPLTAITTIAQVLGRGNPDPRAKAANERITISARRMSRMIDQLLDVTRLRLGSGLRLEPEECDLAELCLDLVDELDDEESERGFEVSRTGDLVGVWDTDRLGEAVSNVLGNALEHGRKDEDVLVHLEGSLPDQVTLTVENARAIAPEVAATLFEPFTTGAQKPPGKGLGLGLYISREIVRAHGGDLVYEAPGGDRSRFRLSLPRAVPEVARSAFGE